MRSDPRHVLLVLGTALLTACATSYQPESMTGGYSDTQIANKAWLVDFNGNGYTRPARARDFALLRGCELVMQAGCTHYRLMDSSTVSRYNANYGGSGGFNKPAAQVAIECSDAEEGLDAADTASRLRSKYSIGR